MRRRTVVLVNANTMRPPVAPLALDYLAGALERAGYEVRVADLNFAADADGAVAAALDGTEPIAVGVSFRNTDDCFWPSGSWFVPQLEALCETIRRRTTAPIVLGGCGFSIFPVQVMDACGVDFGVVGDGEVAFVGLLAALTGSSLWTDVSGVAYRDDTGTVRINPPAHSEVLTAATDRAWIDNARYFREGGMGNVETKRGCPGRCIYCADPIAKGQAARLRAPAEVAEEIAALAAQGVDVLHLCDSEFNLPLVHAEAVCDALIRRRSGERVRWYCYAAVHPFPVQLALAMRRAGCVGVNFGADSGCDRMLAALGRGYTRDAVKHAVRACKQAGMTVMLDLLIGGPGEDPASVRESVDYIKSVNPDRAGAAVGLRVYPGTRLARTVADQGSLKDNPHLRGTVDETDRFFRPVFYIDRQLGDYPGGLVAAAIGEDDRFFQPAGGVDAVDYNYNDHSELEAAIAGGERGAFWDILRRVE